MIMMRWMILVLCALTLASPPLMAEPAHAILAVVAADSPTLETLSRELLATRDRIGLSQEQVTISRVLTQRWKPSYYKGLGIKVSDLPMLALARTNAKGKVVALIGYPDFVERSIADPGPSAERILRRWAEANGVAVQPAQPLVRAASMSPEPGQPFPIGSNILLTVQAASGGTVVVNSASNRTVTLPELGGGLYQGNYTVSAEEQGDVALMVHFVGSRGEETDYPLGVFQAMGWVPPKILSINPLGGDVYQIRGSAPPGSVVKAKCHIDMGRFLFMGYPDYDGEWTVSADERGEFAFNLDLNQAETRRNGDLEAQFTAYAENPDKPEQRTEEIQFNSTVRMATYTRSYNNYYGSYYSNFGWGRPAWGLGWGRSYRGYGRCR